MTRVTRSPPVRKQDSVVEQFSGFLELVPVVDRLMAETAAPRSPEDLLDLVEPLGLGPGTLVIDAGSYDGGWARRLEKRFGSEVLALEVAPMSMHRRYRRPS